MTENQYPQCRVVPLRMLAPDTVEKYLNEIVKVKGIRRMMVNGPSLPAKIPYGPARGADNPNSNRKSIMIGDSRLDLRVQVGQITFEVEDQAVIDEIKTESEKFFTKFPVQVLVGKFMKTDPSLVDYCRYGPKADPSVIGLVDPRRNENPVIIQGTK